jgi:hypothetical protein
LKAQDFFEALDGRNVVNRLMCAQILAALIEANRGVAVSQLMDKAVDAVSQINAEYL